MKAVYLLLIYNSVPPSLIVSNGMGALVITRKTAKNGGISPPLAKMTMNLSQIPLFATKEQTTGINSQIFLDTAGYFRVKLAKEKKFGSQRAKWQ